MLALPSTVRTSSPPAIARYERAPRLVPAHAEPRPGGDADRLPADDLAVHLERAAGAGAGHDERPQRRQLRAVQRHLHERGAGRVADQGVRQQRRGAIRRAGLRHAVVGLAEAAAVDDQVEQPRLVDPQRGQARRRREQLHGRDRRRVTPSRRDEPHAVAGGEQERLGPVRVVQRLQGRAEDVPAAGRAGRVDGRQMHRDRDRVRRQDDPRVRAPRQLERGVVGGEERLAGQRADGDDVVVGRLWRRVTSATSRPVAAATSARSAPS